MNKQRYIRETGVEARISAIVEPIANDMGFDLVRVKILPDNGLTLQIMFEDKDGNFSIADCEKLSREINPALDAQDPLEKAYHLEISSSGIDRPLVRARDFARYIGHEAKIELFDMLEGRRRFRGDIVSSDEQSVTIRLRDALPETDPDHRLEFALIAEAKLMMSDKLLEEARIAQEKNKETNQNNIENLDKDIEIIKDIPKETI